MIKNIPTSISSRVVLGVGIAVALFFVLLGSFMVHQNAQAQSNASGRLVAIHDRGEEKVLLTDAKTVGEALSDAGITLDNHDAVEPALSQELIANEYQVNIYRSRPVTVIDGATREKIVTAYQTAEQIVKDVGITLYPEDTTTLSRSDNMLADGAGLQLEIDRATTFSLNLYGSVSVARTQAETVGDMLKDKSIELGDNDRVSVPLSTIITSDMDVRIWREGKQTITVEEAVAFDTKQVKDANREYGYSAIQTPGVNGKKKVTYEIEIRDGKEVKRTEIATLVTAPASTQVEIVGSKPQTLPYTGGGSKTEWLEASAIPSDQWGYADFMVGRESGWNPNAVNASSGACGLAQALPCSKVGGNPYDPVNSLNWMNGYVNGRYGGWEGAYNFWQQNHWY